MCSCAWMTSSCRCCLQDQWTNWPLEPAPTWVILRSLHACLLGFMSAMGWGHLLTHPDDLLENSSLQTYRGTRTFTWGSNNGSEPNLSFLQLTTKPSSCSEAQHWLGRELNSHSFHSISHILEHCLQSLQTNSETLDEHYPLLRCRKGVKQFSKSLRRRNSGTPIIKQ